MLDAEAPTPRVTALMPAYNAERWILRSLQSLLTQTFAALEIVVVDDGSTDSTPAIVERLAESDPRLRLLRRPHAGISHALNHGLEMARGVYVARLDADDIALPDRIARQAAFLDAHAEVAVVGGQMIWINTSERKLNHLPYPLVDAHLTVLRQSPVAHPATMLRRQFILDLGGYRSALDGAEDYDLWLRVAERAAIANLPDPVTYYREHEGQVTRMRSRRQQACALLAQALARIRQQGRPDPLPEDFELSAASVSTLGVETGTVDAITRLLSD